MEEKRDVMVQADGYDLLRLRLKSARDTTTLPRKCIKKRIKDCFDDRSTRAERATHRRLAHQPLFSCADYTHEHKIKIENEFI